MPSCQRCSGTQTSVQAFLLTCRGCSRTWHHRCHIPPLDDDELLLRLRATNLGDTENSLSAWMCRRCKRGLSMTPSVVSSREQTVSSEVESTSGYSSATSLTTHGRALTADPRAKQDQELSREINARSLSDKIQQGKKSDRQEPTEAVPAVKHTAFTAPSPRLPAPKPTHVLPQVASTEPTEPRDADVQMTDATQLRVSQDAEDDDDPEDLYGPPVERRIVRILPSLAEELRDQRRRAAAGQDFAEKLGRAPLAPDWILAKRMNDPMMREPTRPVVQGRKPRKSAARRLGENGLNVDELVDCLTIKHSVRAHKA